MCETRDVFFYFIVTGIWCCVTHQTGKKIISDNDVDWEMKEIFIFLKNVLCTSNSLVTPLPAFQNKFLIQHSCYNINSFNIVSKSYSASMYISALPFFLCSSHFLAVPLKKVEGGKLTWSEQGLSVTLTLQWWAIRHSSIYLNPSTWHW